MVSYQFGLRYRADESEDEGRGSLFLRCETPPAQVCAAIKRLTTQITQEHPTAVFDGLICYGISETP